MNLGLRKDQIKLILLDKLEEEPDLKYYMDNDYVMRLIELLVEGVAKAIDENNKTIENEFRRLLK